MRKTKLNEKDQKIMDAMSEKSDEDGGFTVPQDIQTDIHELRRTDDDLEQYYDQTCDRHKRMRNGIVEVRR